MKKCLNIKKTKVDYPPFASNKDLDVFDSKALKTIAEGKVKELKKFAKKLESNAEIKEDLAYLDLQTQREYSVPWFEAMVFLYKLEDEREKSRIWIRYWQRLGNLYTPPKLEGHISEYDIEKAKSYPIQELLETSFKNAGSGKLKSLCPFHEERTPSFVIYTNENTAHCFGCSKHINNAINFLMERDNIEFKEAVRRLL